MFSPYWFISYFFCKFEKSDIDGIMLKVDKINVRYIDMMSNSNISYGAMYAADKKSYIELFFKSLYNEIQKYFGLTFSFM